MSNVASCIAIQHGPVTAAAPPGSRGAGAMNARRPVFTRCPAN